MSVGDELVDRIDLVGEGQVHPLGQGGLEDLDALGQHLLGGGHAGEGLGPRGLELLPHGRPEGGHPRVEVVAQHLEVLADDQLERLDDLLRRGRALHEPLDLPGHALERLRPAARPTGGDAQVVDLRAESGELGRRGPLEGAELVADARGEAAEAVLEVGADALERAQHLDVAEGEGVDDLAHAREARADRALHVGRAPW